MSLFDQCATLRASYPGVLILMRVGDYYEAFDEDADSLASVLGITKTMRGEHRMAGFPHHSLESYLSKLVKAGVRVAVADPVKEKPDA